MMKQLNQFPWSYKHFEKNSILFWNRNNLQVCLSQHFPTPGHINSSTKPMGLLHSFPASELSIRSHSSSQTLWDCVWIRFQGKKIGTHLYQCFSPVFKELYSLSSFSPKAVSWRNLSSVFADCVMLEDSLKMTSADTPWHINLHIFCVTIHCEVTPCAHFPPAAMACCPQWECQSHQHRDSAFLAQLWPLFSDPKEDHNTCGNRMSENVVNKVLTPSKTHQYVFKNYNKINWLSWSWD